MSIKEFVKKIWGRFQDLILELISFKFLLFALIVFGLKETAYLDSTTSFITTMTAGAGTLAYKAIKDIKRKKE